MIQVVKNIGFTFIYLVLFFVGSYIFAEPTFAPTIEVKVLGATTTEEEQLSGLVFFKLDEVEEQTQVRSTSFLVQDLSTDGIILGKQINTSLPIASLTKLMTVWTTLQYYDEDDYIKVPSSGLNYTSPSLNLIPGDEIKVKDLVMSSLIGSSNDAANLLGQATAQKVNLPFSELMNQEAVKLKMHNSRFSNPMGFDSSANYSSAVDLGILINQLEKAGVLKSTGRAASYQFNSKLGNSYKTIATNKLIQKYPDITAVKTGYTNLALGSMINILSLNEKQYLIIVIGSPDRETDTLKLREALINRN